MENVKPYSNTGVDAFNAWDSLVQSGRLREISEPNTWEELNRCVCEGMFVAENDQIPVCVQDSCDYQLRPGEMSKVRTFWETNPVRVILMGEQQECLLWKYGNELQKASPEQAMEIWETMAKQGIEYDETAFNMYISALQKGTDRKYMQEIERAKRLVKSYK